MSYTRDRIATGGRTDDTVAASPLSTDRYVMEDSLVLIDTETCTEAGRADQREDGVFFPEAINGWTDVLDCRHSPYTEHSLEKNCHLAAHVRKPYILIEESQLEEASDDEALADEES